MIETLIPAAPEPESEAVVRTARGAARLRPSCRGIDPDMDNAGPYCRSCGYALAERGNWYRHGTDWRHPEAWTNPLAEKR